MIYPRMKTYFVPDLVFGDQHICVQWSQTIRTEKSDIDSLPTLTTLKDSLLYWYRLEEELSATELTAWNNYLLFKKLNHFWNCMQCLKMKCRKGQTVCCIALSAFYQVSPQWSKTGCELARTLDASVCFFYVTAKFTSLTVADVLPIFTVAIKKNCRQDTM